MTCDDRQLSQSQREAGYTQNRTGVIQAVRPFSGNPTLPNLIDYINREVFPALRRTRDAVNDVYLQTKDNAPSGNPLQFYFSTDTTDADPTVGRIRFNASPQNTTTTIRVSQTNARLQDVAAWLDVMAGSATEPLGTITLVDAVNPSRFLRFDLDTMVDQGTYWNLGVTLIESSHDDPFVDDNALAIGFTPGVAGSGATVPPGSISPIATDTFIGNITGSTGAPSAVPLASVDSTSITYDGTAHEFRRAALTGFTEAAANGNATTSAEPLVTYTASSNMSAERVLSNGTLTTIDIGTAGQVQVDLSDMAAGRVIGKQIDASTGAPVHLTGGEVGELIRYGTVQTETLTASSTTNDLTVNADTTVLAFNHSTGIVTVTGFTGGALGRTLVILNTSGTFGASLFIPNFTGSSGANRVRTPGGGDLTLRDREGCILWSDGSTCWRVLGVAKASATADRDYGDITVTDGGITWTIDNDVISNAKLRNSGALSVIGRSANSSGDPADISATAASGAVLRESGGALGFGVVANAGLANMTEGTVKGRATGAGTGAPTDLTGAQQGENVRLATVQADTVASGTVNDYAVTNGVRVLRVTPSGGNVTINGFAYNGGGSTANAGAFFMLIVNGTGGGVVIQHDNTGSTSTNRIQTPDGVSWVLGEPFDSVLVWYTGTRWNLCSARSRPLVDADYGDITVSGSGITWTIDNDVVSDAKLRNSAALSVIGRSANSTGDPADIAAANDGEVLRRSGTALGFGTVATAGLTDAAVTLAKMENRAAGTVIGRQIDAGSGVPVALTGAEVAEIIRWSNALSDAVGGTYTDHALDTLVDQWRFTATATITGIANGSEGKLLVIENAANAGSGITVTLVHFATSANANRLINSTNADIVLHPSMCATYRYIASRWRLIGLTALQLTDGDKGEITVATGGTAWTIDNDAVTTAKILDANVTLAKMANLAQSRFIGRAEGAGTGAPVALTPTQTIAIIDGENATWTGTHSFTGASHTVDVTGAVNIDADAASRFATSAGNLTLQSQAAGSRVIVSGADDVLIEAVADDVFINSGDVVQVSSTGNFRVLTNSAQRYLISSAGNHTVTGVVYDLTTTGDIGITSGEDLTLAATVAVQITSPLNVSQLATFTNGLRLNGVISPTALAANTNNWNPTGLSGANVIRVSLTGGNFNLTGITAQEDGRTIFLLNVSSEADRQLTLVSGSGSSTAANRFDSRDNVDLLPSEGCWIWYDGTSDRWRIMQVGRT